MAIRPIAYDPTGGLTVWHDDLGHAGTVAFAGVRFGRTADGSADPTVIELACPVCGWLSWHPIGGGAAPGPVQKLFLRTVLRRAVALGLPATFAAAKAFVRTRAEATDGVGRFRLAAMQTEDDDA